jgi:hypothetical protein
MPDGFRDSGDPNTPINHPAGIVPTGYLVHNRYKFLFMPVCNGVLHNDYFLCDECHIWLKFNASSGSCSKHMKIKNRALQQFVMISHSLRQENDAFTIFQGVEKL